MNQDRRNYWLTWSTSLLFFMAFYTLLTPLPLYLTKNGLPDWQIGVIMGAFGVASLLGRPLAGLGADHFGLRPVMLCGVVALIVGVAGLSATTNPALLFVLRLFQAAGYVAFTTASNALVVTLAAPGERKSMLTRFGAAANVAMTLTPATINALLPLLTLGGAFWVAGGLALLSGLLAMRIHDGGTTTKTPTVDWRRLRLPKSLLLPMVLAALLGCAFGAFLQFLPLLTERRGGLPSGPVFAVYGAGIVLTRLLTARWMDQGDQRLILRIGFTLVAVGLLLLAVAQQWPLFLLAALCVAAGSGLQTGLLMNLHVEALPPTARGSAIAFYYLGFDLGIGGGAWLLTPLLQGVGIGALYAGAASAALLGALLVHFVQRPVPVLGVAPASTVGRG